MTSQISYSSFPRTKPSPSFVPKIIEVFRAHESKISTILLAKGLESNVVLMNLRRDLVDLGFEVESGKTDEEKIHRPVFFGENDIPTLRYEIDAYHSEWLCGLEIEAGRAILGNAIFRDLFQAMVMVDISHLCLAVPNVYKYNSGGKPISSRYYDKTITIAETLFGHDRVRIPYSLTIIGY